MSETHDETRSVTIIFEWGDQKETYVFNDATGFVFDYQENMTDLFQGKLKVRDVVATITGKEPLRIKEDR